MTVIGDFIQIVGNDAQLVSATSGGAEFRLKPFSTGGRRTDQTALFMFQVSNLAGHADIFLNGVKVGTIASTGTTGEFKTQLLSIGGGKLRDGDNDIALKNTADSFLIKNFVCFFHQDS